METLADRIKYLREIRRLTQVRMGIELGVAQETISGYEIGRIVPPADMLVKLADCLNTSVDYLLGRTDNLSPLTFNAPLSSEENELLYHFKRLPSAKQERVIGFAQALEE